MAKTAIKIFLPTLIFSFLSSSLYFGFIMNKLIKNTRLVRKYSSPPPTPNLITFPIKDTTVTPKSGIEDEKQAPNILILNNEKSPPMPTNDNINDRIYIIILFRLMTSDHLFIVSFFLSCIVYSFIF